ncbi:MAG: D-sedoheptulose-7-phosphate isomerase [Thermodesulfobacteriota bacterium]
MKETIISILRESADLKLQFAKDSCEIIEQAANVIIKSLKSNGRIFLFGNGGSAADCQHLASEFINKFNKERRGLSAVALTTDSSVITSIANDASFSEIFSRQIDALAIKGDLAIAITTSGKSPNVIEGLKKAKEIGLTTVAFTGKYIKKISEFSDYIIQVPSSSTPRVQEIHITLGHIICELVEMEMFK